MRLTPYYNDVVFILYILNTQCLLGNVIGISIVSNDILYSKIYNVGTS